MSQSLPEDILHKVTLTKIINSAAHASGWAKFYFHVLLFDFVSVLLDNINWDEKEKHQVLVSFYELAHLTRELPSWETSKLGTTTCSFQYKPAAGCSGQCWKPQKSTAREMFGEGFMTSVPRWNDWEGWEWGAALRAERTVWFSIIVAQKEQQDSSENKYSLHLICTTRIVAPKISCLISKVNGIITLH